MPYHALPAWARLAVLAGSGLVLLATYLAYEGMYGRPRWIRRLIGNRKEY